MWSQNKTLDLVGLELEVDLNFGCGVKNAEKLTHAAMRMAPLGLVVSVVSRLSWRSAEALSFSSVLPRRSPFPALPCGQLLRRRSATSASSGVEAAPAGDDRQQPGGKGRRRRRKRGPRDPDLLAAEDAPFQYHEELEVTIETLTNLGDGVARVQLGEGRGRGE